MAYRGQTSKAVAIKRARLLGLKVVERAEGSGASRHIRIQIGDSIVEWRAAFGGSACYRCDGWRAGYVGEAIDQAVRKQLASAPARNGRLL